MNTSVGGNARDLQLRHTFKMSAELMLRLLSASVAACRHAASIIREIAQGGNLRIKDKVCDRLGQAGVIWKKRNRRLC